MKIFNVVLAVLIFLLAVTSAVFSFFLFEKRAQLVESYGKMSKQYAKSTKDLDKDTGKGLTAKITAEEMGHNKSENLDALLKEFDQLTTDVVKERDMMAQALTTIAETLEINGFNPSAFTNISTCEAEIGKLQAGVSAYKTQHDQFLALVPGTYAKLAAIPAAKSKISGRISTADLKGSNFKSKYAPINAAIDELNNRNKTVEAEIKTLARSLELRSNLAFSATSYKNDLASMKSQADKIVKARNDNMNAYQREKNQRMARENEIKSLKRTIANNEKQIASLKQEVKDLRQTMMVPEERAPKKDSSKDALDMIRTQGKGRVLSVDDKYGIVIISLGKKTRVVEAFGKVTNVLDPQIPEKCELMVVRNMPSGKAEHVNIIKIVKLDEHCSVAEPLNREGSKPIQPGDMVYFSDDQIKAILDSRK